MTDEEATAQVREQIATALAVDLLPAVLDALQVARVLNLSKWSVYELARSGGVPALRLGRTLRFPVVGLIRMLAADGPAHQQTGEPT